MKTYYLLRNSIFFIFVLWLSACVREVPESLDVIQHRPENKNISQRLEGQLTQWRGAPYRLGGNSKKGIDCSGFTKRTYQDLFKINLPRVTRAQLGVGAKVAKSDLRAGDLVFFKTGWGRRGNGLHVGIYQGNQKFIHASTSKGVMKSSLNEPYWKKKYIGARRIIDEYQG